MAKARMIYQELHRDTDLGELSVGARWLFVGTIIHSDDDGRMRAGARYLTATIFPYDPPIFKDGALLEEQVSLWRDKLVERGLLTLYEKDGKKYLSHKNWIRWQHIRKDLYQTSQLPNPTDDGCHLVDIALRMGFRRVPEPLRGRNGGVTQSSVEKGSEEKSSSKYHSAPKTKAPGDGRIPPLIKDFFTRLETKLGEKPQSFNGGAAGRAFARMLKTYTPEQIIERMQSWFDSSDPFIVKNGWRIEMFNMNFNMLKGGPIAQSSKPGGGYIGAPPIAGKYAALSGRPKHS